MYPTLESRADLLKMLGELTENRRKILRRCEALTPEQLNDPVHPGTWSVLQNLQHLAWAEAFMLAWIAKRPDPLPDEERPPLPPLELDAVRTALDEAHAAVLAFLKASPEEVLRERAVYGRGDTQTVGGILFHLVEHEIHHRAFVRHKLARLEVRAGAGR
jgi:uncharacterized damage-inducible protein DinB